MKNKRGRKPLPEGMKAVTTSIRLRPDRLAKYKKLGGIIWMNDMLDNWEWVETHMNLGIEYAEMLKDAVE